MLLVLCCFLCCFTLLLVKNLWHLQVLCVFFLFVCCTILHGCWNFPKIWEPPTNSRHQVGDMMEVSYWGVTDVRCHSTKFCCLGLLVPEFCASLPYLLKYKMIPVHSPTTSGKYMYKTCVILCAIVWQPPHFQTVHYKTFWSLIFRKCGNLSLVLVMCC